MREVFGPMLMAALFAVEIAFLVGLVVVGVTAWKILGALFVPLLVVAAVMWVIRLSREG